jgi:beta-glucanase (GH16 family)
MNKGSLKKIFTTTTSHRTQKLLALGVTTSMLITMIAIDASASPVTALPLIARPTENVTVSISQASLRYLFGNGKGHRHSPVNAAAPVSTTSGGVGSTTTSSGGGTGSSGGGTGAPSGGGGGATTTSTPPTTTTTTTTQPAQSTTTTTTTTAPSASSTPYPVGTLDSSEPSGYAPPSANVLSGYNEVYSTDFTGTSLPSGWGLYSGQPGGDPGALWSNSAVAVSNGLLSINTTEQGGQWVTGGTCMCSESLTYGAFFVRSRMTGPGPTGVELLWPSNGSWPPEIDFNETYGTTSGTSATVHYSASNSQIQHTLSIDMTQWHTWGVVWTPTSITYTVDGQVWATVTNASAIPNIPMWLSLQSQTWCASSWACPTAPQTMQVDWVAEYSPNS